MDTAKKSKVFILFLPTILILSFLLDIYNRDVCMSGCDLAYMCFLSSGCDTKSFFIGYGL